MKDKYKAYHSTESIISILVPTKQMYTQCSKYCNCNTCDVYSSAKKLLDIIKLIRQEAFG